VNATDLAGAFLADIVAHPADDAPRLVYADWLEDHGEAGRAEFIRLQCELARMRPAEWCVREGDDYCRASSRWKCRRCALRRRERELLIGSPVAWGANGWFSDWLSGLYPEHDLAGVAWTFRRGFVHTVRLPLAAWLGERCGRCGGCGEYARYPNGQEQIGRCRDCRGTGYAGGHGKALVRCQPIERVDLSDKEPTPCGETPAGDPTYWRWFDGSRLIGPNGPFGPDGTGPDELPRPLWRAYVAECERRDLSWEHPTRGEALDVQSAACLRLARSG
jgi:uncharacterized protein (TIGR02996 family)